MKPDRAQFDHAAAALRAVLDFTFPADEVLSRYFRGHRALGQQDRAFIAEAVFGVLRRKSFLDHITQNGDPRQLLLAWLARIKGISARELEPVLRGNDAQLIAQIKAARDDALPPSAITELPDWVVERLSAHYSQERILELGRALQQPAPLDLRVNSLLARRNDVLARLQKEGLPAHATPYSPLGIRVDGRPSINRHPLFLDGTLEVQDEGSQLLCCLLAPTRHDLVVDFCAGAGGKTLALGAMMSNRGRLYAFDTSAPRLKKFQPRLARSGLSNVHPRAISGENDLHVKRLAGKIDRVLIDAPCSGLGTLRRNPDLKWRQSLQSVTELMQKQAAILRAAATLLKPGGRLVYATCSLLAEENEHIVETFLAAHPAFVSIDCARVLAQQQITLGNERDSEKRNGNFFRLAPHTHGTDGFFGAVIERSGS